MKFIIFAPGYDPDIGGVIVLHKLCHVLNSLGYECKLYPYYNSDLIDKGNFVKPILSATKSLIKSLIRKYKTNPSFDTPLFKQRKNSISDEYVVIYPEIVHGNPLGAKNVVRWLLHKPGFHTGNVYYGSGELYFDFNSFAGDFCFPGSKVSENRLFITHMPIEIYNLKDVLSPEDREGTAYCLRKGKDKPIRHDLENSVLIDNKSHHEIAEIFKRVKTFISYDSHTAYSVFAALCGADVIVVPDEGVSKEQWYPEESQRYGLAYGFSSDEIAWARDTRGKLLDEILKKEHEISHVVSRFVNEVEHYFES